MRMPILTRPATRAQLRRRRHSPVHSEHPATAFTTDLYLSDASALYLAESAPINPGPAKQLTFADQPECPF